VIGNLMCSGALRAFDPKRAPDDHQSWAIVTRTGGLKQIKFASGIE
jgi:hypothetical protein